MRLGALSYVLIFLFCGQLDAYAQGFQFDESGYESVMRAAASNDKPILYMLYASWCPHCHVMRDQVFPDAEISALVKEHFVVAAQDVEKPGGKALARKYNVTSYPSFLILDTKGKLLYGFNGEFKKQDFANEIRSSLNPKRRLPYLADAFAKDVSDAEKCLEYIMALRKARQPADAAARAYFATQPESALVSALNWKIIANGISDIASREFQYVMKHQKEFAAVSSEKRVARKIENIITETLRPASENGDTIAYKKARKLVQNMNHRKGDSLGYVYDRQLYERLKDWKSYRLATFDATDAVAANDYRALRATASTYLAQFDDEEALLKAVSWARKANSIQESKEGLLLEARLYEKMSDFPKAVTAAGAAKAFCEKVGFGTKEADELLQRLQSK